MSFREQDFSFWLAVLGAAGVRLWTSPQLTIVKALASMSVAVFSAYVFTDPALDWLQLNPKTYKEAVAALLGLTGEGLMRFVVSLANNPRRIIQLIQLWRSR